MCNRLVSNNRYVYRKILCSECKRDYTHSVSSNGNPRRRLFTKADVIAAYPIKSEVNPDGRNPCCTIISLRLDAVVKGMQLVQWA